MACAGEPVPRQPRRAPARPRGRPAPAPGRPAGRAVARLPHPTGSDDGALLAVDAVAFAAGFAYLGFARRIPYWLIHLTVAASSLLICSGIYFSGVATGLYSTMFVWVALFSAYFFSPRVALLHLAWLLAAYATVLYLVEDTAGFSPLTRWLLTAIALSVTTGLTAWLGARRRAAERRSQVGTGELQGIASALLGTERGLLITPRLFGY
jgi:hypothetical protein